jgi:hypothetical protein
LGNIQSHPNLFLHKSTPTVPNNSKTENPNLLILTGRLLFTPPQKFFTELCLAGIRPAFHSLRQTHINRPYFYKISSIFSMAAVATQNPAVRSESKSAKKKKAKIPSDEIAASGTTAETTTSNGVPESSNGDGGYESPYIKELYKSVPLTALPRNFTVASLLQMDHGLTRYKEHSECQQEDCESAPNDLSYNANRIYRPMLLKSTTSSPRTPTRALTTWSLYERSMPIRRPRF